MNEKELSVCPVCGWYVEAYPPGYHAQRCIPIAGRRADALIADVNNKVDRNLDDSGKLGYGTACVYFQVDEDTNVRFEVYDRKRDPSPFRLREVWLLDSLNHNEARDLVLAIAKWRRDVLAKRVEGSGV